MRVVCTIFYLSSEDVPQEPRSAVLLPPALRFGGSNSFQGSALLHDEAISHPLTKQKNALWFTQESVLFSQESHTFMQDPPPVRQFIKPG